MKKLIFCFICCFLFSCSKERDELQTNDNQLNSYQLNLISYFKSIALGFEFDDASKITRRWETDMNIFVGGNPNDELLSELELIKNEINDLTTTEFKLNIVNDSLGSNYYIFFGNRTETLKVFPGWSDLTLSNWGIFYIFWNDLNQINSGYMYVDTQRPDILGQKHLLREELTQSLGLARDSYLYDDSIFQQSWTTVTKYSQMDKDIIRLLYHPEMKVGLDETQVENLLVQILKKG